MILESFLSYHDRRNTVYDKKAVIFEIYGSIWITGNGYRNVLARYDLLKRRDNHKDKGVKPMRRKTDDGRKMYELTEEEYSRPITKKEAKRCKHRLERRWYRGW